MNNVEELLSAAHKALHAGNRLVARGYLRRAARTAPERQDIWRDLLEVTDLPADRLRCLALSHWNQKHFQNKPGSLRRRC